MMENATETEMTLDANPLSTMLVYTLFGIFGIVGNSLVLLVIALVDDIRGVTNLFIANQSLIDLSSSVVLIANYVIPLPKLPSGRPTLAQFLCRVWYTKYPFWSLIVASSLNLTLMTLERYFAVFYPIRFRNQSSSRSVKMIAFFPWIIGCLVQIPSCFFVRVEGDECIFFFFSNAAFNYGYGPAVVFLEFILPVSVMAFVYISIFIRLGKDAMFESRCEKTDGKRENSAVADYRSRARRNTVKTMLIVSVFFIICWTTNQTMALAGCFGGVIDFNSLLYRISVFMGFGNMWINPFIYSFQYKRFQAGLKKIFCGKKRNPGSLGLQTVSGSQDKLSS